MADFWDGLSKSCLMVLLSEIGDKTFFIAAVMAMRNPRGEVWHMLPRSPLVSSPCAISSRRRNLSFRAQPHTA